MNKELPDFFNQTEEEESNRELLNVIQSQADDTKNRKARVKPAFVDRLNYILFPIVSLMLFIFFRSELAEYNRDEAVVKYPLYLIMACPTAVLITFSFRRLSYAWCLTAVFSLLVSFSADQILTVHFIIAMMITSLIASVFRMTHYMTNSYASSVRHPLSILDLFLITISTVVYFMAVKIKNVPIEMVEIPLVTRTLVIASIGTFAFIIFLTRKYFWHAFFLCYSILLFMFQFDHFYKNATWKSMIAFGFIVLSVSFVLYYKKIHWILIWFVDVIITFVVAWVIDSTPEPILPYVLAILLFFFITPIIGMVFLGLPFAYTSLIAAEGCYLERYGAMSEEEYIEEKNEQKLGPLD